MNYIIPGQYYNLSNVNKTYRNLSELGPIRYTNITFRENDSLTNRYTEKLLDCRIELTRKKVQSYQTEIAGTNSGGDLGIRGNLSYQNLNLFSGAEVFNMRFTGAIEALKNRSDQKYTSMKEIGAETGIIFPKFFSPFRLRKFCKKIFTQNLHFRIFQLSVTSRLYPFHCQRLVFIQMEWHTLYYPYHLAT